MRHFMFEGTKCIINVSSKWYMLKKTMHNKMIIKLSRIYIIVVPQIPFQTTLTQRLNRDQATSQHLKSCTGNFGLTTKEKQLTQATCRIFQS